MRSILSNFPQRATRSIQYHTNRTIFDRISTSKLGKTKYLSKKHYQNNKHFQTIVIALFVRAKKQPTNTSITFWLSHNHKSRLHAWIIITILSSWNGAVKQRPKYIVIVSIVMYRKNYSSPFQSINIISDNRGPLTKWKKKSFQRKLKMKTSLIWLCRFGQWQCSGCPRVSSISIEFE